MSVELFTTKFLAGLAKTALFTAIKKAKEKADQQGENELEQLLREHQRSKGLGEKVEQRLLVSLQKLHVPPTVVECLRNLESDPVISEGLAGLVLGQRLSPEAFVLFLSERDASLKSLGDELLKIAKVWVDTILWVIGEDPVLAAALTLRAVSGVQASVDAVGDKVAKKELRQEESAEKRHLEFAAEFQQLKAMVATCLRVPDAEEDRLKTIVQSQYQRRFDDAREQLINGSVTKAESEYRRLIRDLEEAGGAADPELLFRSQLNLSSSLIDQQRFQEAEEWLGKAGHVFPDDRRFKRTRAVYWALTGMPERALEEVRELRRLEPDKKEHLNNEVAFLLQADRVTEAVALLEANSSEDGDYYANLAIAYDRAGRTSDAETAALRACELDPDSEGPWIARAYACGFPIVRRRMERESMHLSADNDEIPRLTDAIQAAEKAAVILRQRDRLPILLEVLGNALAFYAAANDDATALAVGVELRKRGLRSEIAARNLFFVQLRSGRFEDAIESADELAAFGAVEEARLRKVHAMLGAGQNEAVLVLWEQMKSAADPAAETDKWITVASRAMEHTHRSEQSLALLENALASQINSIELHGERASLLESLGRIEEAAAEYERAEVLSGGVGQAMLDRGLFLYRNGIWKEASSRFERFGAEAMCSPLHSQFLICLFNLADYDRCHVLVEKWRKSDRGYNETIYAIAARCYHLRGDVVKAKEVLEILIHRGSSRDSEHRKLLAAC